MSEQENQQQDFTEDIAEGDFQEDTMENGGEGEMETNGDSAQQNSQDSGAADAPGRDDDSDTSVNDNTDAGMPSKKENEGKLFVGGLSWETTEKELREYFSKFGEIESINVKTDPNTGRSRGFAFIVFNDSEALDKVIEVPEHKINDKKVDPKKAKARHGKIFVGGLKPELTDEEIRKFFETFGTILEVEMPFDKQKNQRKGFCFITFEQETVVNDLLKTPKQIISGHSVDVKKATPKPDQMMMMRGGGSRGSGRGVRGGGGGGGPRGRGRGWGPNWNGGYAGYGPGYGSYGGGGYGGYDYGYGNYGGYGGYAGYDYGGYGNYGGYGGYSGGGQGGYGGGKSQRGRQGSRHNPY